jgi:hypothetical protein
MIIRWVFFWEDISFVHKMIKNLYLHKTRQWIQLGTCNWILHHAPNTWHCLNMAAGSIASPLKMIRNYLYKHHHNLGWSPKVLINWMCVTKLPSYPFSLSIENIWFYLDRSALYIRAYINKQTFLLVLRKCQHFYTDWACICQPLNSG